MDKRFKKINRLLSEYSAGNFNQHLELSSELDETDAIIEGINMLGEELKEVTVSRNYFNNIFDSVSEMVFILNKKWRIENFNKSVSDQLGYERKELLGKPISFLISPKRTASENIFKRFEKSKELLVKNTFFRASSNEKEIPVSISINYLIDTQNKKRSIILTAKDISAQLNSENLILRAIINTQEKERQRLAQDLHDSLGQQLSAIKFYISSTMAENMNEEQKSILIKSNEALAKVQADMRNICFNLMPKTLGEFGLLKAVKELCNQITTVEKIDFKILYQTELPALDKSIEIDLFRIIQEFINNSILHGKASQICIKFKCNEHFISLILKDNGAGFEAKSISNGMGLQNIQSRVKSHNGEIKITSVKNKGTEYLLLMPLQH